MATYSDDFSAETTGAAPTGWTERWHTGSHNTFEVQTDSEAIGGKVFTIDYSGSARRLVTIDAIDSDADRDDCEILMRFRLDTVVSIYGCRPCVRGSGGSTSEQGYLCNLDTTNGQTELLKFVSATGTTMDTQDDDLNLGGMIVNDWHWLRHRVNGSDIKFRVWRDDEPEPTAWDNEHTDTAVTGTGWAGVAMFTGGQECKIDYFAVGTNGDTAPFPSNTGDAVITQVNATVAYKESTIGDIINVILTM